ncbi:MAG TPA: TonB family protein [bacterium]|uniref:Gram-negative bacterial tonB protein n=1 Tax=candidate division TA06 bacterium ADurb.Bin417 TaxID=1852828 RepID=A0A1V5MIE7_UNCT6|nr:MAG: Gram-negative bacterial tonB protein [candidate division TA06 bacterium ADurb.Bin417]HNQ36119.1 TonB family protein [bacterium]HNS49142.1 TonB family protein [bacterium]
MRALTLSLVLHLGLGLLLVLAAVWPLRERPQPISAETVFLVANLPVLPAAAPLEEASPETSREAGSVAPETLPVPQPPEPSLAERIQTRLAGIPATSVPVGPKHERTPVAVPAVRPEKSPSGTAAAVPPAGVVIEAGFNDPLYLAMLIRRLTESWRPPREGLAVVKREAGVSFIINRSGGVEEVLLMRPSGDSRFDRSAVSAVSGAAPFPPLPAAWPRDRLQVSVRFRDD